MSPIILIVCLLVALFLILGYNQLVRKRNQVDNAFSAIDAMLKKRFDLIPNLVASVKNYSQYEQSTLAKLVELRSKAVSGNLSQSESIELDNTFSQATRGLVVLSESYPELKASDNYMQLQRALNESEEQISAARRNFNASVTTYNNSVQQFPTNLVAGILGFQAKSVLSIPDAERANVNVDQLFR